MVALAAAVFLEILQIFQSSDKQSRCCSESRYSGVLLGGLQTLDSVAVCAAEIQGGFQYVGSVVLYEEALLGGLRL